MSCRTLCWPPNFCWLITVLLQGNVKLHFELFFTAFLWWLDGGGGWHGKDMEIDVSYFSRQKCNCGRLCATAWVLLTLCGNRGYLSLVALLRHCSASLRHVSYPAPQSSVTAVGTTFVSMKDSHTTLSIAPSFLWHTDARTNTIKATWKHVNIHLRPYWGNKVKCVINRFKGSLLAEFNDVPEWNVKNCRIFFFGTNFNAHFNMNMYVILSSTCFGPWHAHLQEEQLGSKKNILYYDARSEKHQSKELCLVYCYSIGPYILFKLSFE